MSKPAWITLALLLLGALAMVSCKSDEQRLLDWYHENYDDVKSGLPPKEMCDRWLPAYSAMQYEAKIAGEQFDRDLVRMGDMLRQGHMSPVQHEKMVNDMATQFSDWIENRSNAFWNQTQIRGSAERTYCFRRLYYARTPSECSYAAQRIIQNADYWGNRDMKVFAIVEYCLENWPGFLETS